MQREMRKSFLLYIDNFALLTSPDLTTTIQHERTKRSKGIPYAAIYR